MKVVPKAYNRKLHFKGYKTIALSAAVAAFGAAQATIPTLQAMITPEVYGYISVGIGIAYAALRSVTNTALGKSE
jgi:hypothetical protein